MRSTGHSAVRSREQVGPIDVQSAHELVDLSMAGGVGLGHLARSLEIGQPGFQLDVACRQLPAFTEAVGCPTG